MTAATTLPSMKRFLPPGAELVVRPFSPATGEYRIAFGVITPFVLAASGATPPASESNLWERVEKVLGKHGMLDEGWPKMRGELLAAGACYPPAGHAGQPVSARIAAGPIDKRLAVFGPRVYGAAGGIGTPLPFERMPLGLEQAWGGAGVAANPAGKGVPPEAGAELPNVEDPAAPIASASDNPAPATFGPLPFSSPQRTRFLGAPDTAWLKERWPHLPDGTQPDFFQAAPEDQWRTDFWAGGEAVRAHNMHPQDADLAGTVPDWRPRFFVHQGESAEEAQFVELNVHADTVWLLPEEHLGLLIYRAVAPVKHADARDINAFQADLEDPAGPEMPITHYLSRCLRALTPQAFRDLPDPAELQRDSALLSDEALRAKVREQKAIFQQLLADHQIDEATLLEQLAATPQTRRFAELITHHGGNLSGFINEIEQLLAVFSDTPAPDPEPVPLAAGLPAAMATAPEAPRTPDAHTPDRQPVLHSQALAARHRERVLRRLQTGQSCRGLDLNQANLAGCNLAGADFAGALLNGANLAGAQAQGANFQGAQLNEARLDAANLAGCNLADCSLAQASLKAANLQGATLDGSDCTQVNLSGTDLSGVSLRGSNLERAWLRQIRAVRLQAQGSRFAHANLQGADLSHSTLDAADFSGAILAAARLDQAQCTGANFTQADLSNASLAGCDLSDSQATAGSQWQGADLRGARLQAASWVGAALRDVRLDGAQAQAADLSDSDLRGVCATRADLRQATLDRADLTGADFAGANLMEASLMYAKLTRCVLRGSNLYGATFVDTELTDADLDGANLERTRLAAAR